LIAELILGRKLSVGAPFFEIAFTPFMVILAIFLPLGAVLPWKRANVFKAGSPLIGALSLSIAIGLLIWSLQTGGRILAPIGLALSAWVILGAFTDILVRCRMIENGLLAGMRRLINLTRADWGKAFAHIGLGLTIFGISAITAWETEDIRVAKIGETFEVSGYTFTFDNVNKINGKNYSSDMGIISAYFDSELVATLRPEKRFYPVQRMPTTEAGINSNLKRDLYVALGDFQDSGWTIRTYVKPFAVWIWIGCLIMSFGGLLSMSDRRLRFALTTKSKSK
jgi:cytochrome c-type biogenesis protein CcmF